MVKLKVKLFSDTNFINMERILNEFLEQLKPESIRDVRVDAEYAGNDDQFIATVLYEE